MDPIAEPDPVSVTVRWLAGQRDLALEVVHDSGREFTVVHPVELEDPTEFVGEGCVILLTGIAFRDRPEALADYVRRVAADGVRGIGFGVGIAHDEVPPDMVAAARDAGISLFVVPRRIPFVSILSAVHAELARQRNRSRERLLEMQGRLNAAATEGGVDRLLDEGARCLGAHLMIVDNDGRWLARSWAHHLPEVDLDELAAVLRERGFGVATRVGGFTVIVHRMGDEGERVHALVAASVEKFSVNSRALLRHCAGLAELIVQRPDAYRRTHQELNSLALAIKLGMAQTDAAMSEVFHSVRDSRGLIRPVLLASENPRLVDRALVSLDTELRKRGRILFSLRLDERSVLVLFRGDRSLPEVLQLFEGARRGTRIAIGATQSWEGLGREMIAELERVALGLREGEYAGPDAHALGWLAGEEVRQALSRRARETWDKLGPHPDLARTLEAYLRHSGNVSRAAEELRTHRHTVTKRLVSIASLIEVDLADPVASAELLIVAAAQKVAGGFVKARGS
ncbi:MAG: PucR family transcriptional regulator [Propionibacteriaceae bacterium]|nr:PucR family transcriptional regulator [Propionibacteriaceae bacterium]